MKLCTIVMILAAAIRLIFDIDKFLIVLFHTLIKIDFC